MNYQNINEDYNFRAIHSIVPPYSEDGDSPFVQYWSPVRDCHVEEGYISLTRALNSQAGGVWNKEVQISIFIIQLTN